MKGRQPGGRHKRREFNGVEHELVQAWVPASDLVRFRAKYPKYGSITRLIRQAMSVAVQDDESPQANDAVARRAIEEGIIVGQDTFGELLYQDD